MHYNYEEVIQKIEDTHRFGNLPGVEVTGQMLKTLDRHGLSVPYVHVAGTNGKGSTCAFLYAILKEAGYKVGCFTSPHLIDFRERITVDGQMISKEDVERIGNELLSVSYTVCPTMFDYCVMLAVLYFEEQNCDFAIIETGLGGRLDSTNALGTPEACAITRIGYDHMAILGDNLEAIASEKAGILKKGVPAVIAGQEPEALDVLLSHCPDAYVVTDADKMRVAAYKPGLLGAYQYENAAVAAAVAETLLKGSAAKQACIERGIHRAKWPGRMEILSEEPFFMVDGAHNSDGVRALKRSLEELYPGEQFHFVMGVMADKDYEEMLDLLCPIALDFVTVTPDSARALQGQKLAEFVRERGIGARSVQSIEEVLSLPIPGERTIALGSLYFIGDLKRLWFI